METFTSRKEIAKQDNKESYEKVGDIDDCKIKQLNIKLEKTDLNKTDEVQTGIKVTNSSTGNQRLLKLKVGPVTLPQSAKTPKPPDVPRSTAFCQKATGGRLGGDGEACKEENEEIDYCCIERLPGDGCFSECTEDEDVGNLSDGYCEDDLIDEGIDDVNDESCSEGIISIKTQMLCQIYCMRTSQGTSINFVIPSIKLIAKDWLNT